MVDSLQVSEALVETKPLVTIISALNCEAKPWVDYFGLKKQCDAPFRLYSKEGIDVEIAISGIGSLAMATAVGWIGALTARPRIWLNLGVAGHATLPIGAICRVHSAINAADLSKYFPPLVAKWRGENSAIACVNAPSNSYVEDAMIDMESYAFFKAASLFSASEVVQAIKVVSDNQEQGFEELNAAKISALMLPHVEQVNKYISALKGISPVREIEHPWSILINPRCTHSQRLQLEDLFKKACVLGLHEQLEALGLDSQTSVKSSIERLKALLERSAPNLPEMN